ncbi:unnamed protein product, partial [Meganyctiphanes norvegica]
MHDVFSSVKNLLKIDTVNIDNNVFRLHYKATMFILVAFSVLVTQGQYFGDPIDCITTKMDSDIMDSYCWIHGTYLLPEHYHSEQPHPGLGPDNNSKKEDRDYHMYYQWVTLFLYLQAAMFYLPRYLWKTQEGNKMEQLVQDLDAPIVDDEVKDKKKETLTDYFRTNFHKHDFYAYKFFGCEILNFINVVGQMFFVNRFLGYEFTTYGTRVLNYSNMDGQIQRSDPMYLMFPRVTKCHMRPYGVSGSTEVHDALCVLPLNVIKEKISIFLWFWFIIVAVVTGLALIYRGLCFLPQFRNLVFSVRCKIVDGNALDSITRKCKIGDWLILYQLSKNMDPLIFKEFISELAVKLPDVPIDPSAPPTAAYGTIHK